MSELCIRRPAGVAAHHANESPSRLCHPYSVVTEYDGAHDAGDEMYQQPKPSWWSRNWKWVVPVGCLGSLAVFVGGVLLFIFLVYSGVSAAIRSSDAYQEGMARAQAHPEVKSALGEPIESGFWISGSINVSGSSGRADVEIPISGPKGSGTLYVVGTRSAGRWQYSTVEVEIPGRPARINLLTR